MLVTVLEGAEDGVDGKGGRRGKWKAQSLASNGNSCFIHIQMYMYMCAVNRSGGGGCFNFFVFEELTTALLSKTCASFHAPLPSSEGSLLLLRQGRGREVEGTAWWNFAVH